MATTWFARTVSVTDQKVKPKKLWCAQITCPSLGG